VGHDLACSLRADSVDELISGPFAQRIECDVLTEAEVTATPLNVLYERLTGGWTGFVKRKATSASFIEERIV